MSKPKLVRIATNPLVFNTLLKDQLEFISKDYEVIIITSNTKNLDNQSLKSYEVPFSRNINPIGDLFCLLKLIRLINSIKPHIVHTHTPKAGLLGMVSSYINRVPFRIHTVAGLPLMGKSGIFRIILTLMEIICYKFSTEVLVNSKGLKKYIHDNISKSDKIKLLYKGSSNGIDLDLFNPLMFDNVYEGNQKNFKFLFLGRIVKDKGINELIEAFDSLIKIKKDIKLTIVGKYETELDPIDEKNVRLIERNKYVNHIPWIEDVRLNIMQSDVLVLPSYREGFPNVVLQALAMGKPVICSDINGCNELITHNFNGLLCKPKSSLDLMKKMQYYVDYPEEYTRHASNCRVSVEDFSRSKVLKWINNYYLNLK